MSNEERIAKDNEEYMDQLIDWEDTLFIQHAKGMLSDVEYAERLAILDDLRYTLPV